MTLSLDARLTRQRGTGIYAVLPWFKEYWVRDQFIAPLGATLVNGQFASAKNSRASPAPTLKHGPSPGNSEFRTITSSESSHTSPKGMSL